MNNIIKNSLSIIFFTLLLYGCGKNENIEGDVKDIFGNPLADVVVQVEKSMFSSKTDVSGHYKIDFAPGTFNLIFSKLGFTTQKLELSLLQKAYFPAQPMLLYPTPPDEGVYYVGKNNFTKLHNNQILVHKNLDISFGSKQFKFYISDPDELSFEAGKIDFIDNTKIPIYVAKISENGLIYDGEISTTYRHNKYLKILEDNPKEVGDEKLVVRTLKLEPGHYAWIELEKTDYTGLIPKKGGSAYSFEVVEKAEAELNKNKQDPRKNLDTAIIEAIHLLSKNDCFSFFNKFVEPNLKTHILQKISIDEIIEQMSRNKANILQDLVEMKLKSPVISSDGHEAVYQLKDDRLKTFVNISGIWYVHENID